MRKLIPLFICLLLGAPAFCASKRVVQPKGTPAGMPFSPGILVDGTLYVSGTQGQDPKTNQLPKQFEAEVRQALENINVVLKQAGMTPDDVVAVQVYLSDINLFSRMNTVYKTFFREPRPARTTVAVASLVGNAHIEITVTAHK